MDWVRFENVWFSIDLGLVLLLDLVMGWVRFKNWNNNYKVEILDFSFVR